MTALTWLTAAVSLVGVFLNLQKKAACFYFFAASALAWMIADYAHGLPAQSFLQAIYLVLSIYGIWHWGVRERASMPRIDER